MNWTQLSLHLSKGEDKENLKHSVEILPTHPHHHIDHAFEGSEFLDDAIRMNDDGPEDSE